MNEDIKLCPYCERQSHECLQSYTSTTDIRCDGWIYDYDLMKYISPDNWMKKIKKYFGEDE